MPNPPTEIVRAHAEQGSFMVAGADDDCKVNTYSSQDGTAWNSTDAPPANWWTFVPGGLSSTLESGAGVVDLGCPVIAMSTVQVSKVLAGCEDGTILATNDRGGSWDAAGSVTGLVDLAFIDEAHGYALASTQECPSRVLATGDGGSTWTQMACLESWKPAAIAAIDSLIAVAADDTIWVSSDSGQTWDT